MRVIRFSRDQAERISGYESVGASALPLGDGHGEAHTYAVYLEPGGSIGAHPAGFAQLFVVLEGSGWVAGPDGRRAPIATGEGACFERGEVHSKGSDEGMTALMIQVTDLELPVGTDPPIGKQGDG